MKFALLVLACVFAAVCAEAQYNPQYNRNNDPFSYYNRNQYNQYNQNGQYNPNGQYNRYNRYNPFKQYQPFTTKAPFRPFVTFTTPAPAPASSSSGPSTAAPPTFAPITFAPATFAPSTVAPPPVAPVSIVPVARVSSDGQNAETLKYGNEINPDGAFNYFYETSNGIAAQEQGVPRSFGGNPPLVPVVAQGSFSWTSPEGQPILITYVADENGYQPSGDAIPTPPALPPQIARALEYTAKYIAPQQ